MSSSKSWSSIGEDPGLISLPAPRGGGGDVDRDVVVGSLRRIPNLVASARGNFVANHQRPMLDTTKTTTNTNRTTSSSSHNVDMNHSKEELSFIEPISQLPITNLPSLYEEGEERASCTSCDTMEA